MRIGFWRLRSSGVCNGRGGGARRDFRCLRKALEWSSARGLLYFRVPPSMLPANGEIQSWLRWKDELEALGAFIRARGIRLSTRPGAGVYLGTANDDEFRHSSVRLGRLAALLDFMNLDSTHKIQVTGEPELREVGPSIGKDADLARFDERHRRLPEPIQRRLVVESPDRRLGLRDSLKLWSLTGVPIVLRTSSASVDLLDAALSRCRPTWTEDDGSPVVDLQSTHTPRVDHLLAGAPDADYMVEANTLPERFNGRKELPSGFG